MSRMRRLRDPGTLAAVSEPALLGTAVETLVKLAEVDLPAFDLGTCSSNFVVMLLANAVRGTEHRFVENSRAWAMELGSPVPISCWRIATHTVVLANRRALSSTALERESTMLAHCSNLVLTCTKSPANQTERFMPWKAENWLVQHLYWLTACVTNLAVASSCGLLGWWIHSHDLKSQASTAACMRSPRSTKSRRQSFWIKYKVCTKYNAADT